MTASLIAFVYETQLSTTEADLLSASSTEKKFLGSVYLTNTSASNVTVTLWRILTSTNGTVGSGGNWIFSEIIPAGRSVPVLPLFGQVLGNSMKISGLASVAGVVNVDISGTTET